VHKLHLFEEIKLIIKLIQLYKKMNKTGIHLTRISRFIFTTEVDVKDLQKRLNVEASNPNSVKRSVYTCKVLAIKTRLQVHVTSFHT
jgi:hypothetical protein